MPTPDREAMFINTPLQKPEPYEQLPDKEKVSRFANLKKVIAKDSIFRNFLKNAYKYSDQFKMPKEAANTDKSAIFNQASSTLASIDLILDYYAEVKKRQAGVGNKEEQEGARDNLIDDPSMDYARLKGNNTMIDVEKLSQVLSWSLDAFVNGGKKIGRNPDINESDVSTLVADFKQICNKVNQFN